ncbi:MAG: guanylate kinase [Actinomycetaceae bacterium]|nr:guanylate kinase [Actinomycetaceae bacterium]MDU0969491.1 guanylate kinase [Actinomycetaceae bacterium]
MSFIATPVRPRLVVLAGPSGVGKGTVVHQLLTDHPEVYLSVSATTRRPRTGEVDGVHYHFVSDAEFDQLIDSGGLLEWATVHGLARYGTPAAPIDEALAAGRPVLVEIDLDGVRQVRASRPDAMFVFLEPPSVDELVRRLVGRGTESPEEVERRLITARREMASRDEFDYVICNDTVERAADELADLLGLH